MVSVGEPAEGLGGVVYEKERIRANTSDNERTLDFLKNRL